MEKRDFKRLGIIFIYFLILGLIVALFYFWLRPRESCFDQKINQNEEGVDCGGVCEKKCVLVPQAKLSVEKSGFVESGVSGEYNLYAEVYNPNNNFGSGHFEYDIQLKDSSGMILGQISGESFILPGERKYLTATNFRSAAAPSRVELLIGNVEWEEFLSYNYAKDLQLKIVNQRYQEISSGIGFSESLGLLKNESPFDFSLIKIIAFLKDSSGQIIAFGSTAMNTVRSGESREFKVFWPNRFPNDKSVEGMEFQTEVNVFSSEAFADKYFRSQKFQNYNYQ